MKWRMKFTHPQQSLVLAMLLPMLLMVGSGGCARRNIGDSPASTDANNSTALSPGARAVTIGEGGPGLAACVARGRVVNLSPNEQPYLPVRAAPFADAKEIGQLHNGAQIFVCTRSIDQQWRGVVIPPSDNPQADCGVKAAVATAHAYDGPCQSGWVSSAFLELGAG